ncbi:oxygen-independent coproporphyrinogen III oxidase [bacterium]|nr:oxygen-independent coproporphyrinogen III oxidase [bacterium]
MLTQDKILHFLGKYDKPGPRYTSYPTVPAWIDSVGPSDYQQSLQSLKQGDVLSLYFHLPFCENLCHFCGCMQVITKDHSRSRAYIDTLKSEIKHVVKILKSKTHTVGQIHFGGGTPNFVQPDELEEVMTLIRSSFNILPDAEIAIEMHPRTSTEAFCHQLADLQFNRISLGVQDLDPKVQKLINRHQTFEMTRDMVALLRSLGFKSFNMDLVYGLPGQSMEGWEKTIAQVLEMNPDRLAVYSYAHVPWMRPVQRTFKDEDLPTPEMKLKLFEKAYRSFLDNGFDLIGMDHFAKKDDELAIALKNKTIHRNFMGYSTRADSHQIGFGVSSISFVNGNFFQNDKVLKSYDEKVKMGLLTSIRGFLLSRDDHLHRDFITHVMCHGYINFEDFDKEWGIDSKKYFAEGLKKLDSFVKDGLLVLDDHHLEVQGAGFLFLRNIAMNFDPYLEDIQAGKKNPTFSRTV